jgi:hypothetical protein
MADNTEDVIEGVIAGAMVPAVRLSSTAEREPVKRVPLFYIDDDEYTVPAKPRPGIGLRYLWILRHQGEEQATAYILEAQLGTKGYQALMNYKDLTQAEFNQVLQRAIQLATGNLELPKLRRSGNVSHGGRGARGRSSGR